MQPSEVSLARDIVVVVPTVTNSSAAAVAGTGKLKNFPQAKTFQCGYIEIQGNFSDPERVVVGRPADPLVAKNQNKGNSSFPGESC